MNLQRLVACTAAVLLAGIALPGPLHAHADSAASDTAAIAFTSSGVTCLFSSLDSDDLGDVCGFTVTSQSCSSPPANGLAVIRCSFTATLFEPTGEAVSLSYTITGADAGVDVAPYAGAVTGTASDDGALFAVVGQASGIQCFISCSEPSTLSLTW